MTHLQPTGKHTHLRSAVTAAVYVLGLHLIMWLSYIVVYLLTEGWLLFILIALLASIVIGIIGFFVVRRMPCRRLSFYASLLVCHILLSAVTLLCGEVLIAALQRAVGIVLTGQPEENFDGVFYLVDWLIFSLGMGWAYALAALVSLVKYLLRTAKEPAEGAE